jgi:hypothetical protein
MSEREERLQGIALRTIAMRTIECIPMGSSMSSGSIPALLSSPLPDDEELATLRRVPAIAR